MPNEEFIPSRCAASGEGSPNELGGALRCLGAPPMNREMDFDFPFLHFSLQLFAIELFIPV
jgi:hypothetical protein